MPDILPPKTQPEIDALEQDIIANGCRVPIVIVADSDFGDKAETLTEDKIVDGRERWHICQKHKLHCPIVATKIPAKQRDGLRVLLNSHGRDSNRRTAAQRKAMVEAIAKASPTLPDAAIAQIVGVERSTVCKLRKAVGCEKSLVVGKDGRLQKCKTRAAPLALCRTPLQGMKLAKAFNSLKAAPEGVVKDRDVWTAVVQQRHAETLDPTKIKVDPQCPVHHCDFRELENRLDAESVDLILTDPMWSITDKQVQKDWRDMAEMAVRLLKPDTGRLAIYVGGMALANMITTVADVEGLEYLCNMVSIAVDKLDELDDNHRRPRSKAIRGRMVLQYPILLYARDNRARFKAFHDVVVAGSHFNPANVKDKKLWNYCRSRREMYQLVDGLSDVGDLVMDPFSGTGTTGWACRHLKRNFVGSEANQYRCKLANDKIAEPFPDVEWGASLLGVGREKAVAS